MKSINQLLNLNSDIKSVYLSLRKVRSVKDKWFMFYLIKDFMLVGYFDKVQESKFKRAFDVSINYMKLNGNMSRMSDQYNWETDYHSLWQYQLDKLD